MEHSYEQYQTERQDRIDRYVLGRMTEEERKEFEQDMADDHELREQTVFTECVRRAVVSREEKLAKMRKWDKKTVPDVHSVADSGNRKPLYWISSIAAVLVVGFFVVQLMRTGSAGNGNGSMGLPAFFEPEMNVRGGSGYADIKGKIQNQKFAQALEQITNEEIALTKDSLEMCGTPGLSDEERESLRVLVSSKRADLNWLKAWALLGIDRKDEAMTLIDSFRGQVGEYTEVADSLYNLISTQ